MTTRTVTTELKNLVDIGWAYGTIYIDLVSTVMNGDTIYPSQLYKIETDANGLSSDILAVPDTGAYVYRVKLPDGKECDIQLEAGASITLGSLLTTWCEQVILPLAPDSVYLRLDGDNTMTGEINPVHLTTVERDLISPANGAIIFNSTLDQLEVYINGWETLSNPVTYDATTDTYRLDTTADGQTQNLGQELFFSAQNDNGTAATTLNPKVFLSIGAVSGNEFFHSAIKAVGSDIDSGDTYGLNTTDMGIGTTGKVVTYGLLNDVNSSSWPLNATLYIDPLTRGDITDTKPDSDAWEVGRVVKSHATQGIIFVNTISATNDDIISNAIFTSSSFWLTGETDTLGAGTFYKAITDSQGSVATVNETVLVPDNSIVGLNQDHVSEIEVDDQLFISGEYTGVIEFQVDSSLGSNKFHVEVYVTDTDGNVVDSGLSVPVGDLGVRPMTNLQSPVLENIHSTQSFAPVTGLLETDYTITAGQRWSAHILCEKIGTQGGSKTFTVYFGSNHLTRLKGIGRITSDNVENVSTVNGATVSDALETLDHTENFFNGSFLESHQLNVTSDGVTVSATLEKKDTGDLTMVFSDGFTTLDCSPIITLPIQEGTDTVPVLNYLYIPFSTKVLTYSTTSWPTGEHNRVGIIFVQSAASTQTYGGIISRWNDASGQTSEGRGHSLHIAERLRQLYGEWDSGTESTLTIVPNATDDLFLAITDGFVYQLHRQSYTGIDQALGDSAYVINHPTTPFVRTANLNDQLLDASGGSLSGRYYSLVVWGANSSNGGNYAMVNLPNGSYNKLADLLVDSSGYNVYDIPSEFKNVGFLIGQYDLKNSGSSWTLENYIDLRGKQPNTSAGSSTGSSGITTLLGLTDTPSAFTGEAGKFLQVNVGESAVEFVDTVLEKSATIQDKVAAYTLTESDNANIIHCDGTFTVTLPDGLSDGFQIVLNNVGTGTITITATTTLNTLGGANQIVSQYAIASFYHKASNVWYGGGDLT